MFEYPRSKEPGPILTLNGYAIYSSLAAPVPTFGPAPVPENPKPNERLPSPSIIALHQKTHEEFHVAKILKTELNSQKCSLISNELKVSQQLQGLPHLRLLCDVIDHQEHLFLFYSAPKPIEYVKTARKFDEESQKQTQISQSEITLLDYLKDAKKMDEQNAKIVFGQIIKTLKSVHERRVAHRDVKLPSILINPQSLQIRIADFSQAVLLEKSNEMFTDRRGSPAYVSPEIILGKPYHPFAPDYWAAGIILHSLLTGTFPFMDSAPRQLFEKILTNQVNYSTLSSSFSLSLQACHLISGLLTTDQSTRLANIRHILNHDWLKINADAGAVAVHPQEMEEDDQVVPDFN